MRTVSYNAPIRFDAIASPSSGSLHQNFLETFSNKTGQNKHTYIHMLHCIFVGHHIPEEAGVSLQLCCKLSPSHFTVYTTFIIIIDSKQPL
jgi:hypothetical protein